VVLHRDGGRLTARVDDRDYCLSILEPQRGVYSFVEADEGGRSTEAVVHERDGTYRVRLRGRHFLATAERPGQDGCGRTRAAAGGPRILKAAMPGRVVRVMVEPGATVNKGQGIVVIEAMKMENEIGSPGEGVVKELHVEAGDRVESGASLAVIE
jgi:3-methylcrotonyl-CoA carboxylase alpha subunit